MLFQFEAMDATGTEIKDVIEAPDEGQAQAKIRQMGYFVTMLRPKEDFLLTPVGDKSAFPRRNPAITVFLVIPAITAFLVRENIGIFIAFIVGLMIGLLF